MNTLNSKVACSLQPGPQRDPLEDFTLALPALELPEHFQRVNLCIDLHLNALFQPQHQREHTSASHEIPHGALSNGWFPISILSFVLLIWAPQRTPGPTEWWRVRRAATFQEPQESTVGGPLSEHGQLRSQEAEAHILAPLANSCVTLDNLLTLSESVLPHL